MEIAQRFKIRGRSTLTGPEGLRGREDLQARRTHGSQQDVGSAAVAQASYLLPPQEVQFLRHNGAQTVSGAKATTAV